jgi:predicted HAD superfamily Cof-like phosphohydrolase/predicted kinase
MTPAEMLREFHTAFRLPMRDTPGLADVPDVLIHLRSTLLHEEAQEYVEASLARDRVGMADALGDVTYVAYGNALTYGIDLDAAIAEAPGGNGGLNLPRLARRHADAAEHQDLTRITHTLADVVIAAYIIAAHNEMDLQAVLAEVHRSNMSKLGADGRPILREDGKVLKGPNYTRPDIAAIVGAPSPEVPQVKLTLVATVGLPACGKTTWLLEWLSVDPAGRVRFNRDLMRVNLYGDAAAPFRHTEDVRARMERRVTAWQHQGIALALADGCSVGVDDTNLDPVRRAELQALAIAAGAEFVVQDFRHVDVEECVLRDKRRFVRGGRLVGEDVIRWMHKTYIAPGGAQ